MRWVTVLGLGLQAVGAWIVMRSDLVTPAQAVKLTAARYGGEGVLKQPAPQNLLQRSRSARAGFALVLWGSVFQAAGAVWGS